LRRVGPSSGLLPGEQAIRFKFDPITLIIEPDVEVPEEAGMAEGDGGPVFKIRARWEREKYGAGHPRIDLGGLSQFQYHLAVIPDGKSADPAKRDGVAAIQRNPQAFRLGKREFRIVRAGI